MQRVAILGLGIMGGGMADTWLSKGFPVSVWNRTKAKAEPLRAKGAIVADTPRQAAESADVILAMVANDGASRDVWLGPNGALAGAKPGAVVVESSTLTPEWIAELAGLAKAKGLGFVDAPVTGSKAAAASGQLVFLCGGDAADVERARPALQATSKGITHLGPVGTGSRWKLINNMMVAIEVAMLAEALTLAEKAGFDKALAGKMIGESGVASPVIQMKIARMVERNYANPDFALDLMLKDSEYAKAMADRAGMALKLLPAAAEFYRAGAADGHGAADLAAVAEPVGKGETRAA
jgi:3-hydroxyisobutyrate dehydrogenase